jgi:hypothetical protein
MTYLDRFNEFANARGDGLHPKLRELLSRSAAPFSECSVRSDGMLQAGPSPASEIAASCGNVTLLTLVPKCPVTAVHELEAKRGWKS